MKIDENFTSELFVVCLLVCFLWQGRPCHLHSSQLQEKGEVSGITYPYPKREDPPLPGNPCGHGQDLRERHKEGQAMHGTVACLKPAVEQKQNMLIKKNWQ